MIDKKDKTKSEDIHQKRDKLKRIYGEIYERLNAILFQEDPIRINYEYNTDEYEPEVDTILLQLSKTHSVEDIQRIVHKEFVEWFDDSIAGPREKYHIIAQRISKEILPLLKFKN